MERHGVRGFPGARHHLLLVQRPQLPDELVTTAEDVYIRFHGTKKWYRHDYTGEELRVWAERVREAKPARVWAYFNNDREGYAIKNARSFLRLLREGAEPRRL